MDQYDEAGHPIVQKRRLKRKAPRTIESETKFENPIREYFGKMDARKLGLADCDNYHTWCLSVGYTAHFKVRGHDVSRKTRGGDRAVDWELVVLRNALELAVRRGQLPANPLRDRGQYTDEATIRHCREVAPTPDGLAQIVRWLRASGYPQDAQIAEFLAYTGLRIGEGLNVQWPAVDWEQEVIHITRSKNGVFPFVLILPELARLLRRMRRQRNSEWLFPSPYKTGQPRDATSFRQHLGLACKKLGLPHVVPHGLRSYFVTQAWQSGLSDAEIAQLIGDRTGPPLISEVYGDVRQDHLLAVAWQIRLTAKSRKLRKK